MTKIEFLRALYEKLSCLPPEDADERLNFYGEMIDDRMDEGLSEEEAVAEMGTVDEIAGQIIADAPFAGIVKANIKSRQRMRAWEIVLLALGSPVWISLLLAGFSVLISLFAALWSLVISLWAVCVALAAGAFGGVIGGIGLAVWGHAATGAAMAGAAFFCAGVAILMFFVCKGASKGVFWFTRRTTLGIGRCFFRRKRREY